MDKEISAVHTSADIPAGQSPSSSEHGAPEVIDNANQPSALKTTSQPRGWRRYLSYFLTKEFWTILGLGQVLAIAITGTNTLTTLLAEEGTSIPAFQTFFNYVLLNIIYTSYTLRKHGTRGWSRMVLNRGWKYIILSFLDVEGNYFTVLAYRYTTILSAQLINFWAIVIVVTISFLFLHVRYHWAQVLGILVCVAGMGLLLASDHITGANGGSISRGNQLKGDLFALLGATFYGLSNVAEEYIVSTQPLYEVIGQMGFWGMLINGVQAAIFDRSSFRHATWNGKVGGYLTGYTLILTLFYSLTPILYRLASAAFFNISLLTGNFWGVIIGLKVFGLHVHWMYPLAFTLIMVGHFVYYFGKGVLGEARKAWLGEQQEKGISGLGTAKRKLEETGNTPRRLEAESAGVV
ncbi:MAG: hypothetical protein Q9227_003071 [Pyrenula ochraceoflavens]